MPEGTVAYDTDMQTIEGFDGVVDGGQESGLRSGHVWKWEVRSEK